MARGEDREFTIPYTCQLCWTLGRRFATATTGAFVEHMHQIHGVQINHGDIEAISYRWKKQREESEMEELSA